MRTFRSLALGSSALVAFGAAAILEVHRRHPQATDVVSAFGRPPYAYDDRQIQGTSVSRIDTLPGRVQFHWTLGMADPYPFVGFLWEDTTGCFLDFRHGDSLRIDWESDFGRSVRITVLLDVPGLTRAGQPLTRVYLQTEAIPPRQRGTSALPLSAFRPPAWWYRTNNLPFGPIREPLDRVVGLSFESGEVARIGDSDVVRIHGIQLVDPPGSPWPVLLLVAVGTGILVSALWPVRASAMRPSAPSTNPPESESSPGPLPIVPAPLEIPASRADQIRHWMETNYARADLTLEDMSRDLGLSDDILSREIRRTFQDTFKGTLNRLRLTEARRLLAESELGIAEIAYKVGYGNVSHFNRLAKEAWSCPPTELRARIRSGADA